MQEENELVERISECSVVIRDIDNSPAWKVIIKDMQREKERIDNNWQGIYDSQKLQLARVLKMATSHILTLKEKYGTDLEAAQDRLDIIRNPKETIDKDYDTEGIDTSN